MELVKNNNSATPGANFSMTDTADEIYSAADWAIIMTASLAILISVLGFFGNLLTIVALPKSKRLQTASTWFVVNLAIIEGLFCITILPISAVHLFYLYYDKESFFTDEFCGGFVFIRLVTVNAEVHSIAAIAVNRCVLIAFPHKFRDVFTNAKTVLIIIGIWVYSAVLMLTPLTKKFGEYAYNNHTMECDFTDSPETGGDRPKRLFLSLGFFLPCLVIIVSYSYIFYKARQSTAKVENTSRKSLQPQTSNSLKNNRQSRTAEGLKKREIGIARTIGIIFLAFLLCCTPVSLAHYFDKKNHNPTLLLLLHPVYWAQYCINIFIYVWMNNQYRDAYVSYISRWWPNFREITERKFNWQKEVSSSAALRPTRNTARSPRKPSSLSLQIESPNDPNDSHLLQQETTKAL